VYVEAKARLAIVVSEKKRKLRKEGRDDKIDEDTPDGYSKALWITVTKVGRGPPPGACNELGVHRFGKGLLESLQCRTNP
jgi:hypothetical protein